MACLFDWLFDANRGLPIGYQIPIEGDFRTTLNTRGIKFIRSDLYPGMWVPTTGEVGLLLDKRTVITVVKIIRTYDHIYVLATIDQHMGLFDVTKFYLHTQPLALNPRYATQV